MCASAAPGRRTSRPNRHAFVRADVHQRRFGYSSRRSVSILVIFIDIPSLCARRALPKEISTHLPPVISGCRTAAQQIGRHDTDTNAERARQKRGVQRHFREPVVQVRRAPIHGRSPETPPENPSSQALLDISR